MFIIYFTLVNSNPVYYTAIERTNNWELKILILIKGGGRGEGINRERRAQ